jgi:hypothetical protein
MAMFAQRNEDDFPGYRYKMALSSLSSIATSSN